MLEPEYFRSGKEAKIIELWNELEDFILRDIARRLLSAGEMTGTADRLIWKLEQAGESKQAIEEKLKSITKLSQNELRVVLREAVMTSWADDAATLDAMNVSVESPLKNKNVMTVMNAEYQKTCGELNNLTRTTMNQSQKDLINLLDKADMRVSSGTQSYSQAVKEVIDDYASKGTVVTYPSGTQRTLEAAVRCCVVTAMNQTAAQVTNQYVVEAECEYVLVSAHLGARTRRKNQPYLAGHDEWQGKVYRISGGDEKYPNLADSTGYDIDARTGEGRVLNPLGLHGYNCRHSHKPWDISLRNPYVDKDGKPKIDSEENRKQYELTQKQRRLERSIRAVKREMIVTQEMLDDAKKRESDDAEALETRLNTLKRVYSDRNSVYNAFCAQNKLVPQYDRTYTANEPYSF